MLNSMKKGQFVTYKSRSVSFTKTTSPHSYYIYVHNYTYIQVDRERTIQECLNILSHCYIYSEHTGTHAHISIHAMRHSQLGCVQVLLIYVILRAIPM